ncbi:MAG: hypothetical protein HY589_04935 [Candidatus Omnitrophica bacterium]|nr:hypothetical protein [Candidatus Omnitrophota bacterium]
MSAKEKTSIFKKSIALATLWIFLFSNISFALRPVAMKDRPKKTQPAAGWVEIGKAKWVEVGGELKIGDEYFARVTKVRDADRGEQVTHAAGDAILALEHRKSEGKRQLISDVVNKEGLICSEEWQVGVKLIDVDTAGQRAQLVIVHLAPTSQPTAAAPQAASMPRERNADGTYKIEPGKSPKDAWRVIVSSETLRNALLEAEGGINIGRADSPRNYLTEFDEAAPLLGFVSTPSMNTARSDLDGLVAENKLSKRKIGNRTVYQLTSKGRVELGNVDDGIFRLNLAVSTGNIGAEISERVFLLYQGCRTIEQMDRLTKLLMNITISIPIKAWVICSILALETQYALDIEKPEHAWQVFVLGPGGKSHEGVAHAKALLAKPMDLITEAMIRRVLLKLHYDTEKQLLRLDSIKEAVITADRRFRYERAMRDILIKVIVTTAEMVESSRIPQPAIPPAQSAALLGAI